MAGGGGGGGTPAMERLALAPGAETFAPIFATLYPVAYTLKFALRAEQ